ncbi:MAG: peptidase S8, partial [Candidatus Eremiobacteraeota bacterium]|nr:peptidase S8 [Candidatus Eremiobacteraeota bacterium]
VGKPTCLVLQGLRNGNPPPPCSPSSDCGFTASQLETAYGLTSHLGNGSGTNVAVIEAGDLASASTDLATYRTQYGLGTASFFKYNENGQQSNYPPTCENYGWCLETALDIDMVSAACPKCTIFLMEAKGGISDFEAAEASAVSLGATIASNSWICYGSFNCGDSNFPNYFNSAGVAYLASSGDASFGSIGGPSVLSSVIAIGGTQLTLTGSNYSESVWNGAGAGCSDPTSVGSPGVAKPSWQTDPGCTYRTDSDVSAEAGCSPGVAVYTSLYGGWLADICGTSVASPLTAGVIALAGNASSLNAGQTFWQYKRHARFRGLHNIKTGNDGSCSPTYLCTAGTHEFHTYSGPTGWGSPKGIRDY